MAETVFAREEVEELANEKGSSLPTVSRAVFSGFAKDIFMCNSPGDTGYRNSQHEKPGDLRL